MIAGNAGTEAAAAAFRGVQLEKGGGGCCFLFQESCASRLRLMERQHPKLMLITVFLSVPSFSSFFFYFLRFLFVCLFVLFCFSNWRPDVTFLPAGRAGGEGRPGRDHGNLTFPGAPRQSLSVPCCAPSGAMHWGRLEAGGGRGREGENKGKVRGFVIAKSR